MEKRNNKIKIIAIIVALALLLGMVIGGAIWGLKLLFNNDSNTDSNSPSGAITNSETASSKNNSNTGSDNESDTISNGSSDNSSKDNQTTENNTSKNESKETATNSNTTTITVSDIETKKGKKISVPVKVSSNQGFMSGIFELDYDATALEYTGYKQGDLFSDYMFNNEEGKIKFITIANGDVKKNGVLVYLEFKVIDKDKTVPIKLTVNSDAIANQNEEFVEVETKNGSVKIK